MFSSLMISTLHAPLLMGIGLGLLAQFRPKPLLTLIAASVLLLTAYILLEGMPALPPVASKQKLAYLLVLAAVLVAATPRRFLPALTGAFLVLAAVWLGWARIAQGGGVALIPVLAPVITATIGSLFLSRAETEVFLWPLALLIFAAGGAVLSLLGVFVGFAQVSGACAALVGGLLLVLYVATQTGRGIALGVPATAFLMLALTSVVILIGLFAPQINAVALLILSATLLMPAVVPAVVPGYARLPAALRPVAQGIVTAIPAAGALALAYLQT